MLTPDTGACLGAKPHEPLDQLPGDDGSAGAGQSSNVTGFGADTLNRFTLMVHLETQRFSASITKVPINP
jgi:hypothetical protein